MLFFFFSPSEILNTEDWTLIKESLRVFGFSFHISFSSPGIHTVNEDFVAVGAQYIYKPGY